MKEIDFKDFLATYCPICNTCTPYPDTLLKQALNDSKEDCNSTNHNILWDKRDYNRIAVYLHSKKIWSVIEEAEDTAIIVPVVTQSMSNKLIGYIITDKPYESNNISNLKITIKY